MLKHHQGAALTAHSDHTRRREMGLMAVTHNILILRPIKLFYKAGRESFRRIASVMPINTVYAKRLPTPFSHAAGGGRRERTTLSARRTVRSADAEDVH